MIDPAIKDELLRQAVLCFDQAPTWERFFRMVLGVDGIVQETLELPELVREFETTDEYSLVLGMVNQLRERGDGGARQTTRVITVRLPAAMHLALMAEAHDRQTSMNKLCVTKLLQPVDPRHTGQETPAPA